MTSEIKIIPFYCSTDTSLIKGSLINNDIGWGCMIRTSQMLLFKFLEYHMNDIDEQYIKEWFSDKNYHHYSIHNYINHGKKYNVIPGNWISPTQISLIVKDLVESHIKDVDVLIKENSLTKEEIIRKTLVLFPRRLGLKNPKSYTNQLLSLFPINDIFIGIIGGVPNHSLYFFDYKETSLISVDPNIKTGLRKVSIEVMDPCMIFGFYIEPETYEDFKLITSELDFL